MKTKRLIAAVLILAGCSSGGQTDMDHAGPVMNFHRVNDRLVTGGHLVDDGVANLKQQGVEVVIDVRDNSPEGEEERYADAGITWINIPIKWRDPKRADFDRFSTVMSQHQDAHVLVQCAANYRASAMTYLYQVLVENVPEHEARKDLNAVWDPDENDTWRNYIAAVKSPAP